MKYYIKNTIICMLLALSLIFCASAATLSEMRENGEVSDGGIIHHSPRDGEVSDVSNSSEGIIPEISSAIDDGLGLGSSDMAPDNMTDDGLMGGMGESHAPETSRVTSTQTSDTTGGAQNNNDKGGMGAGLIIAILVVVAVVVVIFILLPKRK